MQKKKRKKKKDTPTTGTELQSPNGIVQKRVGHDYEKALPETGDAGIQMKR